MYQLGRAARMERHHGRHKGDAAINLVSMIDMLTVLVFFLLVYSTEQVEVLPSAKDVQLPNSIAEVLIRGASVGKVDEILASDGAIVPSLKAELEAEADGMVKLAGLSDQEKIAA